jgi:replicative DNA helicase
MEQMNQSNGNFETNYIKAEQSALNYLITHPKELHSIEINEDLFYSPLDKKIYQLIKKAVVPSGNDYELDEAKFIYDLNENDQNYYFQLSNSFYSFHISTLIETMEKGYCKRKAKELADELMNETITLEQFIQESKKLESVGSGKAESFFTTETEFFNSFAETDSYIHFTKFEKNFQSVAKIVKHSVNVIAGKPADGKSLIATNLMMDLLQNYPCLYFNLEMDKPMFFNRICGMIAPLSSKENEKEALTWEYIHDCQSKGKAFKVYERSNASTIEQVRKICNEFNKNHFGHFIVFIDYIQLLDTSAPTAGEYLKITEISKQIQRLTADFDCTVFALSQYNRTGAKSDTPSMHDLRGSGQIEQDASTIFAIERKDVPNNEKYSFLDLMPLKNRNSYKGFSAVFKCLWSATKLIPSSYEEKQNALSSSH